MSECKHGWNPEGGFCVRCVIEKLEKENADLRAERDNFQNNGIEVAKQLIKERDEARRQVVKQREILQDILSDCYLTDDMRLEIERLISIKDGE